MEKTARKKILVVAFANEKTHDKYYKNLPPCPVSMRAHIEMFLANKAGVSEKSVTWVDLFRKNDIKFDALRSKIPNRKFNVLLIDKKALKMIPGDDQKGRFKLSMSIQVIKLFWGKIMPDKVFEIGSPNKLNKLAHEF